MSTVTLQMHNMIWLYAYTVDELPLPTLTCSQLQGPLHTGRPRQFNLAYL